MLSGHTCFFFNSNHFCCQCFCERNKPQEEEHASNRLELLKTLKLKVNSEDVFPVKTGPSFIARQAAATLGAVPARQAAAASAAAAASVAFLQLHFLSKDAFSYYTVQRPSAVAYQPHHG